MASAIEAGGPTSYCVAEGVCFLKPSESPEEGAIVKLQRQVGTRIHTTGREWTGPQGGVWAEVDVLREANMRMGWINVRGLTRRPLLVDAAAEGMPQVVRLRYTKKSPIFSCMMRGDETVGDYIDLFASRTGLDGNSIILTKRRPGKAPDGSGNVVSVDSMTRSDVLERHMTIRSADITDTLSLVYTGDFEESGKILHALQDGCKGGA
mmetsp:Transcript_22403/g.62908  ORF Transcript_22403/g.62908 Transcript_22403/m.62908 type:complete len:208 (+) Transcript_22403:90-713(+)